MVKDKNSESSTIYIVNGLKKLIIDRNLEVGDKLPNEFELSELFGKSRTGVREAVKILESFGVLEVRRGDGTYVSASASAGMFDALFFRIIAKGTNLTELIQLRKILEEGIMSLALECVTKEKIHNVEMVQKRLTDAIENQEEVEALVNLDIEFHAALADIVENEVLKNVYMNMLDIFTPYIRFTYLRQYKDNNYSVSQHHELMIRALHEEDRNLAMYSVHCALVDWQKLNKEYYEEMNGQGKFE